MALSIFDDKSHSPSSDDLAALLGRTARLWNRLLDDVCIRHPPIEPVWNFGGAKYGWSLRLRQKDRIVLYLIPQMGQFLAGIVLGEKAVRLAQQSDSPAGILAIIDAAPRYAEGRGIRFPVTRKTDVDVVLKLTAIKLGRAT